MPVNNLFWCEICQRFEVLDNVSGYDRPRGWLRLDVLSSGASESLHFCIQCAEAVRTTLAIILRRKPE